LSQEGEPGANGGRTAIYTLCSRSKSTRFRAARIRPALHHSGKYRAGSASAEIEIPTLEEPHKLKIPRARNPARNYASGIKACRT